SLDGGDDSDFDVGLSGAQRSSRLQRPRVTDGYSDCGPESRRAGLHATRARIRSGDQLGDEADAITAKPGLTRSGAGLVSESRHTPNLPKALSGRASAEPLRGLDATILTIRR